MSDVRLIATDLDGTLLRSDGTVSDRTRAAIAAAADAGLVVAFVTGRPPRWLDAVVDETGHIGLAVGANGAVLYDMETEQVISARELEPEVMHDVAGDLRSAFPGVQFAVEFRHRFAAEQGYIHDWQINPVYDRRGIEIAAPRIGELEEILDGPAVKLLARNHGTNSDEFLAEALGLIGGRATITHSSSIGLIEIAAVGVTKATGLAELAAMRGVSREQILAIGDMPNDVPMLEWVDHSYAVGNAHPAVKAAARSVVGTNDEDAVAQLIESLL